MAEQTETPAATLDALLRFQQDTVSEQRILEHSEAVLAALDARLEQEPAAFTEDDLKGLEAARLTVSRLEDFQNAQEDMQQLHDLDDYTDLMNILTELSGAFAEAEVGKRIKKEIRELHGRRAGLSETRRSRLLAKLARQAPNCPSGHKMELRQGDDWFWGCSLYPKCRETKELEDAAAEELARC